MLSYFCNDALSTFKKCGDNEFCNSTNTSFILCNFQWSHQKFKSSHSQLSMYQKSIETQKFERPLYVGLGENNLLLTKLHIISRAVKTYPVTRPTRRPDRNRFETGRLELLRRSATDFLHQKPTPAGRFRFLSPKTRKTRTDWRKPIIWRKTQIPAIKNPDLGQKTQIQVLFHVDLMKF